VKAGAKGLGEIMKNFGLTARKADGSRLKLDDPELDPIWEHAPGSGFRHSFTPAILPSFSSRSTTTTSAGSRWRSIPIAAISIERVSRLRRLDGGTRSPVREASKTTFIVAHMGWHANNLGRLAGMLDRIPNLYTEVGAILYDLGRQPRAAREFFTKYQDRILFGKDSFQPDEYPYYWRVFETNDEYFDYYRDYHAFWKLYGWDCPTRC
jgi:predicted TIM-barrel fold metal-dependent hydrolase